MTGAEMEALIQRVEQATGPDRELDAEIACSLRGYTIHADTDPKAGWFAYWLGEPEGSECVNCREWPGYTASLDTAVLLVPSGWVVEIIVQHPTYWAMKLRRLSDGMLVSGNGKTEQGCRTAAALRARLAGEEGK